MGATPRILADDILVWVDSSNQEGNFKDAYNATFRYIRDIGGKAAPRKSYTFSSNRVTRKKLRVHCWEEAEGARVIVCTQGRDLGGHFSLGQAFNGSTLTNRMTEATQKIIRIIFSAHTFKIKAKMIRTVILTKGLYGCEGAQVCQSAITKLRSHIAKNNSAHEWAQLHFPGLRHLLLRQTKT